MKTALPMKSLMVFDAAMRHNSFTMAAEELHVTPGAVGQQIQKLEAWLGDTVLTAHTESTLTTPEALKPDWNFYLAYNLFRLAAILQGIAKRAEMGTASSAQAASSGAGAVLPTVKESLTVQEPPHEAAEPPPRVAEGGGENTPGVAAEVAPVEGLYHSTEKFPETPVKFKVNAPEFG